MEECNRLWGDCKVRCDCLNGLLESGFLDVYVTFYQCWSCVINDAFFLQKEIEQKERLLQQLKYKLEENQKAQVRRPRPAQRFFVKADQNVYCCCRFG